MEITYVNQKEFTVSRVTPRRFPSASSSSTDDKSSSTSAAAEKLYKSSSLSSSASAVRSSSGVYICKSIVNNLRHGNFICKSEEIVPEGSARSEPGFDCGLGTEKSWLSCDSSGLKFDPGSEPGFDCGIGGTALVI